jgi:hypothetical protein
VRKTVCTTTLTAATLALLSKLVIVKFDFTLALFESGLRNDGAGMIYRLHQLRLLASAGDGGQLMLLEQLGLNSFA